MGRKKKLIRIDFVDARTGLPLAYTEMPLKEVPEDFSVPTQVEFSGEMWEVQEAKPRKKSKIKKKKQVVVRVKPVIPDGEDTDASKAGSDGVEDAAESGGGQDIPVAVEAVQDVPVTGEPDVQAEVEDGAVAGETKEVKVAVGREHAGVEGHVGVEEHVGGEDHVGVEGHVGGEDHVGGEGHVGGEDHVGVEEHLSVEEQEVPVISEVESGKPAADPVAETYEADHGPIEITLSVEPQDGGGLTEEALPGLEPVIDEQAVVTEETVPPVESAFEEGPVASGESVPAVGQVITEASAVSEESASAVEPASPIVEPVPDEVPVVSEEPVLPVESVIEEVPAVSEEPVVSFEPVGEEALVVSEEPVASIEPVIDEAPGVLEESAQPVELVASEVPGIAEESVVAEESAPSGEPIVAEPVDAEVSVVAEESAPPAEPVVAEAPVVAEESTPPAEPVVAEASVVAEESAPPAEPVVAEAPVVAEESAPPAEPVVAEASIVAAESAPPAEPVAAEASVVAEESAQPAEPVATEAPAVADEPVPPAEPVAAEAPAVADEPVPPAEPVATEAPVAAAESTPPAEPVSAEAPIAAAESAPPVEQVVDETPASSIPPVAVAAAATAATVESEAQAEVTDASQIVALGDLHMEIPTINRDVPDLQAGGTEAGMDVLELYWDYWREVEFVGKEYNDIIQSEFEHIQYVWNHHQVPGSNPVRFDTLHARSSLPTPFGRRKMSLERLREKYFPFVNAYQGLVFERESGLVDGGFGLRLPSGLDLYGLETEGRILFMGIRAINHSFPGYKLIEDLNRLQELMKDLDLVLVDWTSVQSVSSELEPLMRFLNRKDHIGLYRDKL